MIPLTDAEAAALATGNYYAAQRSLVARTNVRGNQIHASLVGHPAWTDFGRDIHNSMSKADAIALREGGAL